MATRGTRENILAKVPKHLSQNAKAAETQTNRRAQQPTVKSKPLPKGVFLFDVYKK